MNNEEWLNKIADCYHNEKIRVISSAPREVVQLMLEKLSKDTAYFSSVCLKNTHPYIPDHHTDAFIQLDNDELKYVCQVWARKMGKTTTKRAKIVQSLCTKTRRFIMSFAATNRQSVSDGLTVKHIFERNEVIRFIYGDLVTKSPWGQDHIELANGTRYMTYSMQSSPRGANIDDQRPDLIILDDFEDEENSNTPEKRDAMMDFILKVLKPIGSGSRTKFVFLGTVVGKDTFLGKANPNITDDDGKLTEDARNSWFSRSNNGAYTEYAISKVPYTGDDSVEIIPVWEEEYPVEFIRSEYLAFKSQNKLSAFYQEYYNIPASQSNPVINTSMIQTIDAKFKTVGKITFLEYADKKRVPCRVYIGADPAVTTGPNSDDTVIFVLGLLPNKTYVIIDIIAEKINIEDQPAMVYQAMLKYRAYATIIECVQYQLSLYVQVQKMCRLNKKNFLIYPLDKRSSKKKDYMEIDGLCHVINTGLTSVLKDCDIKKFKHQANSYSSGMTREHDDTLDGFSLALKENYFPPDRDINKLIALELSNKAKKTTTNFMSL